MSTSSPMHASPIVPATMPLSSSALSANGPRCSHTRTRRALRSSATSRCTSRTIQPMRGANPRCSHSARTVCPTRSRESRRIASRPQDRFGAIPPTTGIICAKTDTYGGLPACAARSSCTTACASITSWASITILRFPQEVPEPMAPGCRDRASSCSSVHSRNSDRCRLSPRTWHSHSRRARPACKLRFFWNGRSGVRGLRHPRANLAAQ